MPNIDAAATNPPSTLHVPAWTAAGGKQAIINQRLIQVILQLRNVGIEVIGEQVQRPLQAVLLNKAFTINRMDADRWSVYPYA
jgi:hypothetical protein